MTNKNYILKISLQYIEPEIWRRFEVPSNITLDRLHDVIQIVMGWNESHLHEFSIGKKKYTEFPESKDEGIEEGKIRLNELVKRRGRKFHYLYDFGDNWEHEITFEETRVVADLERAFSHKVKCLDGARACPPDDVGSISGYYNFCKSMKDKKHKERKSIIEWHGSLYDSEYISIDAINIKLIEYERWSRDRYLQSGS